MRRIAAIATLLVFVLATTPGPALADSPHFIGTATVGGVFSDGGLGITFKEAGLGSNVSITYGFGTSTFIADYGCINHGGNHPSATNKETVQGPITVTGTFSSGKNGTISQTLKFTPPDPNTVLNCPGNQVAVLADIAYSGLQLEDTTNSVFATIDATSLSRTFFTF